MEDLLFFVFKMKIFYLVPLIFHFTILGDECSCLANIGCGANRDQASHRAHLPAALFYPA